VCRSYAPNEAPFSFEDEIVKALDQAAAASAAAAAAPAP
jgi:hypothetical protein